MPDSFVKGPGETSPFKRDWKFDSEKARAGGGAGNGYLEGETITNSTWSVPAGLTKGAESNADGLAVVWISGGTLNSDYTITNTITTSAGRIGVRSIEIKVRAR